MRISRFLRGAKPTLLVLLSVLLSSGYAHAQEPADSALDAATPVPGVAAPVQALRESERWLDIVRQTAADVASGIRSDQDADALYDELGPVLRNRREFLLSVLDQSQSTQAELTSFPDIKAPWTGEGHRSILGDAPVEYPVTVGQLYDSVNELYLARLELLPALPLQRYVAITGTYTEGMRELHGELAQIKAKLALHDVKMRMLSESLPAFVREVPLFVLGQTVELILAVLALLVWRRWAKS